MRIHDAMNDTNHCLGLLAVHLADGVQRRLHAPVQACDAAVLEKVDEMRTFDALGSTGQRQRQRGNALLGLASDVELPWAGLGGRRQ